MKRLFIVLSCLIAGASYAVPTQTHLGTVPVVELSNLQDLTISQLNPNTPNVIYSANESLCLYTSAANHNYRISIEGNHDGQYALLDGGHAIPIELWWSGSNTPTGAEKLTPNQTIIVQNGSASTQPNCPNGLNANLQLRIHSNQLSKLPSGAYSGSFNVIIMAAT